MADYETPMTAAEREQFVPHTLALDPLLEGAFHEAAALASDQEIDPLMRFRKSLERRLFSDLIQRVTPKAWSTLVIEHKAKNLWLKQLQSALQANVTRIPDPQSNPEDRAERERIECFLNFQLQMMVITVEVAVRTETENWEGILQTFEAFAANIVPPPPLAAP